MPSGALFKKWSRRLSFFFFPFHTTRKEVCLDNFLFLTIAQQDKPGCLFLIITIVIGMSSLYYIFNKKIFINNTRNRKEKKKKRKKKKKK
jgi:hypothetical protein